MTFFSSEIGRASLQHSVYAGNILQVKIQVQVQLALKVFGKQAMAPVRESVPSFQKNIHLHILNVATIISVATYLEQAADGWFFILFRTLSRKDSACDPSS